MDDDAEFSLVRFKIDKALLTSAEAECERHGFELFEVVRALVAQIVRDQSIPVDMGGYPRKDDRGAPTPACLQMEPLEEQLESETLLDLIATVIARTSTRLQQLAPDDTKKSELLSRIREQALNDQFAIDTSDAVARRRAIAAYTKLMQEVGRGGL